VAKKRIPKKKASKKATPAKKATLKRKPKVDERDAWRDF
jgi:hypothetical protein